MSHLDHAEGVLIPPRLIVFDGVCLAWTVCFSRFLSRSVDQHNARGYSARQRGDLKAAISEYSAAIALDPMHFKSHFNRGFTHDKVGHELLLG